MFKHQYKILILIICGAIIYLGFYQSSTQKNEGLLGSTADKSAPITLDLAIATLMELSGISKQIDQFPALFKGSMQQSAQQGMVLSPAEYNAIIGSIDSNVLPSVILRGISATLKSELKQNEAQALIAWYQSELGKQISSAEENSQTEQAYQKMVKQKQRLLNNTERVAFAERFDVLLGASEMTSKIQQNVQVAVNSSILLALTPDRPLDTVELKKVLQGSDDKINPAVKQMVELSFVFSYQSLSTEELIKYERFLNQDSTKKFNKLTISGISSGLESAIISWLESTAIALSAIEQDDTW
jgi:hypothetical protein